MAVDGPTSIERLRCGSCQADLSEYISCVMLNSGIVTALIVPLVCPLCKRVLARAAESSPSVATPRLVIPPRA